MSDNVLAQVMGQLKSKPHSVIMAVVSVSDGVINNTTISVEGANSPQELVAKTFVQYEGITNASKSMAEAAGFPVDAAGLVKLVSGS